MYIHINLLLKSQLDMSAINTKQFLKQQTEKYQKHQNTIKVTENILKQQFRIKSTSKIPKKSSPKPPSIIDNNQKKQFELKFRTSYKNLFLNSLQEAITQNTITLELEKARCEDILRQTERELCHATDSPSQLLKMYTHFLETLHITSHSMSPELQHKLQLPIQSSPSKTPPSQNTDTPEVKERKEAITSDIPTATKRKHSFPSPLTKKQQKLGHFLFKGQKLKANPI